MADKPWHRESVLVELYHEQGLSLSEIGDKFDISAPSVRYWMEKHDVDRRTSPADQLHAPYHIDGYGYPVWKTKVGDNYPRVKVHRLLAAVEHGFDAIGDKHVHHKNGVPWDNRPENLEIMEPGDHTNEHRPEWEDKRRESVKEVTTGEANHKSKITEEDVLDIRERYENGESSPEIAEDYPVSSQSIYRTATGKSWSHVGE